MAIDEKTFVDGARLKDIREKVLNPTVTEVNRLTPKVDVIEALVQLGFKDAELQPNAKKMTLTKKDDTQTELDFQPWFDEIHSAIDVAQDGGPVVSAVERVKFKGATVTDIVDGGKHTAVVEIPTPTPVSGQVDGSAAGASQITKVLVKGNVGNSEVVGNVLEIDLPAGGGPGAAITGELDGKVEDITKVKVIGNMTDSTLTGGTLSINVPQPTVITGRLEYTLKEPITGIQVKGHTTDSEIDNEILIIDIPAPTPRVNVKAVGGTAIEDIEEIVFANSTVAVSTTKGAKKVLVTPGGMIGKVGTGGDEKPVSSMVISGNTGATEISDTGVLTIELPSPDGTGMTGEVDGSTPASISKVKVQGYVKDSTVANDTLSINIPEKLSVTDGTKIELGIDTLQVKQSLMEVEVVAGKRKAVFTPLVEQHYLGLYTSVADLDKAAGDEKARVFNRTCGHVNYTTTAQVDFFMWTATTNNPAIGEWVRVRDASSIEFNDMSSDTTPIFAVKKNSMTDVDASGNLIIKDTTVAEVQGEETKLDGSLERTMPFTTLKFSDYSSHMTYTPDDKELVLYKAQRVIPFTNDPDTELPEATYKGSIFYNSTDDQWWGCSTLAGEPKKWTRVIHPGMSGEVRNLSQRVPAYTSSVTVANNEADHPAWQSSGWTRLNSDSLALPADLQGKTDGMIQTFVGGSNGVPTDTRIQVLYPSLDMAIYKRNWDVTKWGLWVKVSINALDLKAHNEDAEAHKKTNPYYKALTFETDFTELENPVSPCPQYFINNKNYKVLGSSNGLHREEGAPIMIPYDGNFQVRGHLYPRGKTNTSTGVVPGTWVITLEKLGTDPNVGYLTVATAKYVHDTTTLKYPPMKWAVQNLELKTDDKIFLSVYFEPKTGYTMQNFRLKYTDFGFHKGRSFITIDEQGNDGGFALGDTFSSVFGAFASTDSIGAVAFMDGATSKLIKEVLDLNPLAMTNDTP